MNEIVMELNYTELEAFLKDKFVKVIPVLLNNDDKSYLKQYFKLFYIELINELKSKVVYNEDDKNPQWKFESIIRLLERILKQLYISNFTR
jgi:hypothetical protein